MTFIKHLGKFARNWKWQVLFFLTFNKMSLQTYKMSVMIDTNKMLYFYTDKILCVIILNIVKQAEII